MKKKNTKTTMSYSVLTLFITFIIGQILLSSFPDGNSTGSSILFILMNLTPMIVAIIFAKIEKMASVLKNLFLQKESIFAYLMAIGCVFIYYGISTLLGNVTFTGGTFIMIFSYMPWAILQGGLEECGWRWYLQPRLAIKPFAGKMLIISVVWFLWHIPIYRLPWITAASDNYLIFYLMILGNTFMFGAIREYSRGAVPCILAHVLIDTLAVAMFVQSNLAPVMIVAVIEIALSIISVSCLKKK
ncbi:MAG: CPBP family intramembrane metalloprotease [Clostridiales bacterium]|nr:CPBP family intramembrane metalloprotease [Clostridiales bacterium]